MKFCFYGSGIYDALKGSPPGGAELQIALIASSLSDEGHQVTIIDNKGSGTEKYIGNIVIKFTAKSNVKGLRFITEKIPNSFRFLKNAHADYYYVRGLSYMNIIVVYVARKLKTKYILGLAHDTETYCFIRRFRYLLGIRTSVFAWLKSDLLSSLLGDVILKKADILLVQHSDQQSALHRRNIESIVFPNIFVSSNELPSSLNLGCYVYVGSLNRRKGLEELISTLEKCKHIKFVIIGKPHGRKSEFRAKILNNFTNVKYLGPKSRKDVLKEIYSSKGLINFSINEGFPNTFLEAWSCGVPVFSMWVDPGGVIEKYNLGRCFKGDLVLMSDFLNSCNPVYSAEKIKEYVALNHSYEKAADRFKAIINDLH